MRTVRRRKQQTVTEQAQQLLERRAERLKATPRAETDDEALLWIAEFPVGDAHYAIPLDRVRAAVPLRMVSPVPLAPSTVIGVLRYQGELIPAFSLVSLVGVSGWRRDPEVLIVVELTKNKLVAIDCEQTPKATGVALTRVEEARARAEGNIVEITTHDMRALQLLDELSHLFQHDGER